MPQRVLVVGAGGIGGIIASGLLEAGADVTVVSTNPEIRAAVSANGFFVHDAAGDRTIVGPIVDAPPRDARYSVVILATQPPQVEAAARSAAPHLRGDGSVVVVQNGLCEERVAAIVGADRVVGGIVAWGASMPSPGRYERTSSGGFVVGRTDGVIDARVRQVAGLLTAVGPTVCSENLRGARWSKLAINCAISSLGTIAGERLGGLITVTRYRRLALAIKSEVVAVARAENVKLEKVSGTIDLDWIALTEDELAWSGPRSSNAAPRRSSAAASLAAKHALLIGVGMKFRRMRSSMLSAIERGRPPAIDFLNGEVVTRGRRHRVATPVNSAVVDAVWAIARGERKSSRATLDDVCLAATATRLAS